MMHGHRLRCETCRVHLRNIALADERVCGAFVLTPRKCLVLRGFGVWAPQRLCVLTKCHKWHGAGGEARLGRLRRYRVAR